MGPLSNRRRGGGCDKMRCAVLNAVNSREKGSHCDGLLLRRPRAPPAAPRGGARAAAALPHTVTRSAEQAELALQGIFTL
eukprot:COSAG01_NODE_4826_length_4712_cov_21.963148_2_plen_80_part_00